MDETTYAALRANTWAHFYAVVNGWAYHPGYLRDGSTCLTPKEAAQRADDMLAEWEARFKPA